MDKKLINKLQGYFMAQPVEKVWGFGSYSRGDEKNDSDIDLMVRFIPNSKISLLQFPDMMCSLRDLLQMDIGLVEEGQLMDFAVDSADKDKTLIYERAS